MYIGIWLKDYVSWVTRYVLYQMVTNGKTTTEILTCHAIQRVA